MKIALLTFALTLLGVSGKKTAVDKSTATKPKETVIDWKLGMSAAEQKVAAKTNELLTFKWTGFHNVYLFKDKAAYEKCDFTGATSVSEKSPYTRKLEKAGTFYYGCKVGSHCKAAQKVAVTITAAATDKKEAGKGPAVTTLKPGGFRTETVCTGSGKKKKCTTRTVKVESTGDKKEEPTKKAEPAAATPSLRKSKKALKAEAKKAKAAKKKANKAAAAAKRKAVAEAKRKKKAEAAAAKRAVAEKKRKAKIAAGLAKKKKKEEAAAARKVAAEKKRKAKAAASLAKKERKKAAAARKKAAAAAKKAAKAARKKSGGKKKKKKKSKK